MATKVPEVSFLLYLKLTNSYFYRLTLKDNMYSAYINISANKVSISSFFLLLTITLTLILLTIKVCSVFRPEASQEVRTPQLTYLFGPSETIRIVFVGVMKVITVEREYQLQDTFIPHSAHRHTTCHYEQS